MGSVKGHRSVYAGNSLHATVAISVTLLADYAIASPRPAQRLPLNQEVKGTQQSLTPSHLPIKSNSNSSLFKGSLNP